MSLVPLVVISAASALAQEQPAEEIVVTATRTEQRASNSPVVAEVITRAQIAESGSGTLDELLEEHPGVQIERSYLGVGIRLQGMDPAQTLVLVDGQRVVGRKDGVLDLSRFAVEGIERVEIVKGPSSALYGADAVAGVVNIITRRPEAGVAADAYASVGTIDLVDASAGLSLGHGALRSRFTGGFHRSLGYDLSPETQATTGSAYDLIDLGNRTELAITPDWRLTSRIGYLLRDVDGVDESAAGAVFDRRNVTEQVDGLLKSDAWLGARFRLQATAWYTWYRDQYKVDQRGSDALDSYEDTREQLAQLTVQGDLTAGDHLMTLGVEGLTEHMVSGRLDKGRGARQRVSGFVQDEWRLFDDRLTLLPGFRFDADTMFGAYPTPKLAVLYKPADRVEVRASAGLGFRAPSFKEMLLRFENPGAGYVVEGNPDLRPETSRNVSGGVTWRAPDATVSLSGYYNGLTNLIQIGTIGESAPGSPDLYGYTNVARARTAGGEVSLGLELPGGLSVDAGYTLTATRDLVLDRPLEGRALNQGTLRVAWHQPTWDTRAQVRTALFGKRPFYVGDDGSEETVLAAPYASIDVRLSQGVGGVVEVFAGVDNLLDAGDPDWLTIPPRSFQAGLAGHLPRTRRHPKNGEDHANP